jgi:cell division protein FtsB
MAGNSPKSPFKGWFAQHVLSISGRRLATLVLVLLSASMAVNFGELIVRGAEVQQKIARQRERNEAHRAEKAHLEALLGYYRSPVHVEMVAREQLGYAREGETVLLPQFVDAPAEAPPLPPTDAGAPAPAEVPPAPLAPNWLRWWQAFFPAPAA